jgi:hypothetical protein
VADLGFSWLHGLGAGKRHLTRSRQFLGFIWDAGESVVGQFESTGNSQTTSPVDLGLLTQTSPYEVDEQIAWLAMAWATPGYSKSRVNDAAREYMDPDTSPEDREIALAVINNWRSSHAFPLNTLQMNLRGKARQVDSDAIIAQRIKRLSSIELKLQLHPTMNLARVQDIGGCRAIVRTVAQVEELGRLYQSSNVKHSLARFDDYLHDAPGPKDSGYRGVHFVFKYFSDKRTTYNGLQIEIQLRTRVQHAWATAVETVGTFVQQALKSSQGEEDWLRFFALMSSEMAFREKTPTVPFTPTKRSDIRSELRILAARLDAVNRLDAYGKALKAVEDLYARSSNYFVLELDALNSNLTVRSFRSNELEQATEAYQAVERAVGGKPGVDVVLVSVESLAALRKAYPNYFLDTTAFLKIVRDALK